MKKTLTYDVSAFGDTDDPNSFSKQIVTSFLVELESMIPNLKEVLKNKDSEALYQSIHKILPTIHILKVNLILKEVNDINANKEINWNEALEVKTIKILEHLKVVEAEMKNI